MDFDNAGDAWCRPRCTSNSPAFLNNGEGELLWHVKESERVVETYAVTRLSMIRMVTSLMQSSVHVSNTRAQVEGQSVYSLGAPLAS